MKNTNSCSRREFVKLAGMAGAAALIAPNFAFEEAKKRRFKIGSTFILWGYGADNLEPALNDMATLGYHAFETFGGVIEEWETKRGGFGQVVTKHGVPIVSAFCATDVLDPAKTKDEREKLVRWTKLLKANGGKLIEYCAGGRRTKDFNYKDYAKNMIDSMNEYAKAVTDEGLVCALHPHTGTPVETEEEIYYVMNNLDTRYMKFGPDVGQIQKGGGDPVKICNDFMHLIEHVHLKDYAGGETGYLGYSPLGKGKVKIEKVLKMLEKRRDHMTGMIMFELDYQANGKPPYSNFEAAKISRDFLAKLNYKFDEKSV
jgi:inosose dehydratase